MCTAIDRALYTSRNSRSTSFLALSVSSKKRAPRNLSLNVSSPGRPEGHSAGRDSSSSAYLLHLVIEDCEVGLLLQNCDTSV